MEPATEKREDFGKLQYGCEHYKRRCKIRAPCCNQIFPCRHCHNDAAVFFSLPFIPIMQLTSSFFFSPLSSSSFSSINFRLFLSFRTHLATPQIVMNLLDAMLSKLYALSVILNRRLPRCVLAVASIWENIIARFANSMMMIRIKDNSIVMNAAFAGACYSVSVQNNHSCVENSMKSFCPICLEYQFDSIKGSTILKCGHTMHMECYREMATQNQYRCPICLKTIVNDMNWEYLDREIEGVHMPEEYKFEVSILCNDCNSTSTVSFHIFGHKCLQCGSYNTRRISKPKQEGLGVSGT
ncbi:E3 ubiquitin-protein ligase MIEL1 [Glycine soja]